MIVVFWPGVTYGIDRVLEKTGTRPLTVRKMCVFREREILLLVIHSVSTVSVTWWAREPSVCRLEQVSSASLLGTQWWSQVTLSHEISVKSHFGYFEMCTILKTRAPADYFSILGLIDCFDLRLFWYPRADRQLRLEIGFVGEGHIIQDLHQRPPCVSKHSTTTTTTTTIIIIIIII